MSKIIRGQSTFLTFLHCCSNNSIKIFVANYRSNFHSPPPLPIQFILKYEREKKRVFFIQYRIISNLIPCENGEKKRFPKRKKILLFDSTSRRLSNLQFWKEERRNDFSFSNLPWSLENRFSSRKLIPLYTIFSIPSRIPPIPFIHRKLNRSPRRFRSSSSFGC